MVKEYLAMAGSMMIPLIAGMREGYDERIKELLDRWYQSRSLPRKKKKQKRKEILLDISIIEYGQDLIDPFRNINN